MKVKKRGGSLEPFDRQKILRCVKRACRDVPAGGAVNAESLVDEAQAQAYDGMSTGEVDRLLVLAARARIALESGYSYVAARLLLHSLYKEAFGHGVDHRSLDRDYKRAFLANLTGPLSWKLDGRMTDPGRFDLERLAFALRPERDLLFKYFGLQTLYDRYFLRSEDGALRLETPQAFWMRVAMGLCMEEDKPTERAMALYSLFSDFRYCHSTPTLFNSGTKKGQYSSCFLYVVPDSLDGIFGGIHEHSRLSKHAGGLGGSWASVRSMNARIKGTGGRSKGLIPWLKCDNDMVVATDQSGKRKGSDCVYIEPWHPDVFDFLDLHKKTGDERRRCHDLNTALWVPDLFMRRVAADDRWTLFCPSESPGLHEVFGHEFDRLYERYEGKHDRGELKLSRVIRAKDLWRKILISLYETSHPWITFKDPSNLRYSNSHVGVVHSSNLCCVTGDQLVVTSRGMFPVKQLAEAEDSPPLTLAGSSGPVRSSPMVRTFDEAPVWTVETEEGYFHTVTEDHPLWVVDKGGWVEARDLKPGDRVALQKAPLWGGDAPCPDRQLIVGLADKARGNKGAHLPAPVRQGSREDAELYLRHLFGWKDGISTSDYGHQADHVSLGFLKEIQVLLLNMGRESAIDEYPLPGRVGWRLVVPPADFNKGHAVVKEVHASGLEPVYCVKVKDAPDRAWTCNGFLTKNTEILLHTSPGEYDEFGDKTEDPGTAVCNLASVNLMAHYDRAAGAMEWDKLKETVRAAVRALDNVIGLNYYPVKGARRENELNRPVGLGMMGWADLCHLLDMDIDGDEAAEFGGKLLEFISLCAVEASADLAGERGSYPNFEGSTWSRGLMPVDTHREFMQRHRGNEKYIPERKEWRDVRPKARKGMRNSNVLATAPNATIGTIFGVSASIDPYYSVLHVQSTMSGDFVVSCDLFVEEMKALGLWTPETALAVLKADGDVSKVGVVPESLKHKYRRAFDLDMKGIVRAAAARQVWIDMGQSLNLFVSDRSLKRASDIYMTAWEEGLKTTYYLRSEGASKVEKSVVEQQQTPPAASCSLDGGGCESCQ